MLTGSGHIEAACKQIVIQHAKQSGMHWTIEHSQDNVAGDNRWSHRRC
jgi:hypothetical protein